MEFGELVTANSPPNLGRYGIQPQGVGHKDGGCRGHARHLYEQRGLDAASDIAWPHVALPIVIKSQVKATTNRRTLFFGPHCHTAALHVIILLTS